MLILAGIDHKLVVDFIENLGVVKSYKLVYAFGFKACIKPIEFRIEIFGHGWGKIYFG